MIPYAILAGVFLAAMLIISTVIRLTARMVAGITPTFGSACGSYLIGSLCTMLLQLGARAMDLPRERTTLIAVLGVSLLVQAASYAIFLKNDEDRGVNIAQSLLIILMLIPVFVMLALTVVLVLSLTGVTFFSLLPKVQPYLPERVSAMLATPAPATPPPGPKLTGPPRLTVPITVATPYGKMTLPAGTEVQILAEESGAYRVRVSGNEVTLRKDQVSPGAGR